MALSFEDILEDIQGNGKFMRNFKIMFFIPVSIFISWFYVSLFLMVSIPDHWCDVPEVRDSNLTLAEQRSLISPPSDPTCSMYDLDYEDILRNGGNVSFNSGNETNVVPCNNGWQYDHKDYDVTLVTKWNLVCDRHYYVSLILTAQKIGTFIGTPILGLLSDKIGRKTVLFLNSIIIVVGEVGCIFSNSVIAFIVWRLLASFVISTLASFMIIFSTELVPPEYRAQMTGIFNISWTVGLCLQPLLAYFARHWVALAIANAVAAIFILCYWK